ncbi:hypothetical protein GPECTOR_66g261 [Gonium pectorale]|uniref:Uncharacterized protein n=1 Tax=Gonium pectorale TaxID=33097 RepID=A0A150G430_GONPE|nr:hypothetical protein GPECTOR_66g261 [Gonium pectorale]|eukprot:KXZ44533.1 hypothetical protein GPECTOR_66g261 [Gonium pectorale]
MDGCWTPLHLACLDGDLARVEQLLQQGAPVDAAGKHGHTPLHCACAGGHVDVVELLISRGASLAHPDEDGDTPLHHASHDGQTGVVEALLRASAPLEAKNHVGLTPLHRACQGGHRDVVEALLRAGADHEAKTNDGETPLDLARAKGLGGLADLLLQHAADMATSVRVAPRSKVVLVGPGGAGKTTLAHRLVHNEYKADIQATDNLHVHEWTLKGVDQQQPTMLSIWDFGGQHGFWSTHAIFMSPEAVYITVYNSRNDGQATSVDAYLERVQTLAPGARNMVVGAWADEGFTGDCPACYKNPVSIFGLSDGECLCLSSKTENGIPELKQAILELAGVVKSASVVNVIRLPEAYVRLRDQVRSLRERMKQEDKPRVVSLDVIRNMEAGAPKKADDLHRFLSKLSEFGELLQFQHVPGLEDKVVVDPEWLADVLGDVVTRDKDKQQLLQLLEGPAMEARCPGNANELVRILEVYGLLYDLGDGERAIIPPTLPTLEADYIEKFLQEESPGPDQPSPKWWSAKYTFNKHLPDALLCRLLCRLLSLPELHGMELGRMRRFGVFLKQGNQRLVVAYDPDQLGQVREQFPGVKCVECRELSDMSMYALDEQAVDWYPVKVGRQGRMPRGMVESQGESEGTLKIRRILGAMERVVEQVKDMPDGTALVVELHQSLVRRAVALHKLVGPSAGEHLPLAVLLPAPDDGTSNHSMELDLDSMTSGLPDSVWLHALCEGPGGLHLTDQPGYKVKEPRAWLRKHGRGLRPLLRAFQLVGVSGPIGTLGAGNPEEEAMDGREMQRTHSRGHRGVTGEGGPTQQLDSMLACLDRLEERQDGLLRTAAVVSPAAEGKGDIGGKPTDLYSACQEACSSITKIIRLGNTEAGGHQEAGDRPAAGGMLHLQRVVTRTAGAMWLCACHAEELGCSH